ncbi:MAG: hypothetical protein NTV57_04345 [Cyanobacteria bacterium]|nr:hypothetical protein [Cyanobacteriota bacterium]
MPEPSGRGRREFLPSANQAIAELEKATGKPVQIVEDPELNVLATIRRAGPGEASHVLRIKSGENRAADYLIVFECRMALRDDPGPRAVLRDNPAVRERVISECEELHPQLPPARAQELGSFIYRGLILQLRSMGPGMLVDRWIRQHGLDVSEAQGQAIESEITNNLAALKPSTRANYPAKVYEASISMNAAYAIHGGDLLGKPYLAVPYLSQGYGEIGRRLISLAVGGKGQTQELTEQQIIDAWAQELGVEGWYEWTELSE